MACYGNQHCVCVKLLKLSRGQIQTCTLPTMPSAHCCWCATSDGFFLMSSGSLKAAAAAALATLLWTHSRSLKSADSAVAWSSGSKGFGWSSPAPSVSTPAARLLPTRSCRPPVLPHRQHRLFPQPVFISYRTVMSSPPPIKIKINSHQLSTVVKGDQSEEKSN